MGQATAKQRTKVAIKDHAIISMVHLKLHSWMLLPIIVMLILLGIAAFVVVGITRPNVESEWKVTDFWGGVISCQNLETGETKKFKPKKSTFFKITIGRHIFWLRWSEFRLVRVGDYIILRDNGWFCSGNHLVEISQKYTDREDKLDGTG